MTVDDSMGVRLAAGTFVAMLLASCGTPSGSGTATPSAAATASPSSTVSPAVSPTLSSTQSRGLVAVEDHYGQPTQGAAPQAGSGVVRLLRMDGSVAAQASFQPPPRVIVGNAANILPLDALVAAGAVYFADSAGVIRRLDPSGTVTRITAFPLNNSQQMLAFAVSPDGHHLGATVLSLPPVKKPLPSNPVLESPFVLGAHAYLDLEWADAGGVERTTLHKDLGTDPYVFEEPTLLVGWDSNGPLATLKTQIGAQSPPLSRRFHGAPLIHLAEDGTHLGALGGAGCVPADLIPMGVIVCSDVTGNKLEVRSLSGSRLWAVPTPCYNTQVLSPDGKYLACMWRVYSADWAGTDLPKSTPNDAPEPWGWIDDATLVYYDSGQSALGWATLSDLKSFHKLTDAPVAVVGVIQPSGS